MGYRGHGAVETWINFNGQGTIAIRDSHNVSSIQDNDTGNYRVTFTTSYVNNDYCFQGNAKEDNYWTGDVDAAGRGETICTPRRKDACTSAGFVVIYTGLLGTTIDCIDVYVAIIGDM
tara:strand:- start:225 stop:578 length:354 start_codon:yes stop_codon:yes gene_type:complete